MRVAVRQLQVLGDKLDIANGAFAQLDLAPDASRLAQVILGELLHAVHFGTYGFRAAGKEQRLGPRNERAADQLVAGHDPPAQERLFLPQPRAVAGSGDSR